jgi:hypothetical protein
MAQREGYRVIAEFSVHLIREGTSMSKYVRAVLGDEENQRVSGYR